LGKHPLQLAGDELNDLQRVHRPAGAQSPTVHEFIQIVTESSDDLLQRAQAVSAKLGLS
jgi:hypothetical protein